MQDHKSNLQPNNHEVEAKPKRKIVHRIVRRVPAKKTTNINHDVILEDDEEVAESKIIASQTKKVSPRVLLAEEEPIESNITNSEINNVLVTPKTPKEMILNELRHPKRDDVLNSNTTHTQHDENQKKPKANIWPYVTTSKQNSKESKESIDTEIEEEEEYESNTTKNYFSWIPWVIIPLIVTGIVIFALSYLAGAEVTIQPKIKTITLATDLIAEKDAGQSKSIPLTVLLVEDKVSTDVDATESKTTIATASGKILVSNKQKVVQTLIKTTRFESSDGKIYRIRENIKIPAAVGDKAGTKEVMVYAESAGPEYNKKDITDFTVPGFKGKPQFDLVTAKSLGPMDGGSSGVKKSVSKETTEEISKNLRIELENKLRARVSRELLQNQVAYENLYQFEYKEPTLEASETPEKAKIVLSGTLAIPIFSKPDLAKELAKASVENYAGEDISLDKIEQISVKFSEGQKINLFTDSKVSFRFEGESKFIWNVDTKAFAKALLNVSKEDASSVSKKFTGIDKTTVSIHPFWKNYFPGNVDDIKITVVETIK